MEPATVVVRWARVNLVEDASVSSHRVALLAAATVLDVPPDTLELEHRCSQCGSGSHGRPLIKGRHIAVTLSRTRGAVVAAATVHEAVLGLGVDVEVRDRDFEGLSSVALSPAELAGGPGSADHLPDEDNPDLRAWVRKEAILKALGTGLAVDPSSITLEGTRVTEGPQGPWWVHDLALSDGLLASVAALGVFGALVVIAEATNAE